MNVVIYYISDDLYSFSCRKLDSHQVLHDLSEIKEKAGHLDTLNDTIISTQQILENEGYGVSLILKSKCLSVRTDKN